MKWNEKQLRAVWWRPDLAGARADAADAAGRSALHLAVGCSCRMVEKLLALPGVAADARDGAGRTPLHYAAQKGARATALPCGPSCLACNGIPAPSCFPGQHGALRRACASANRGILQHGLASDLVNGACACRKGARLSGPWPISHQYVATSSRSRCCWRRRRARNGGGAAEGGGGAARGRRRGAHAAGRRAGRRAHQAGRLPGALGAAAAGRRRRAAAGCMRCREPLLHAPDGACCIKEWRWWDYQRALAVAASCMHACSLASPHSNMQLPLQARARPAALLCRWTARRPVGSCPGRAPLMRRGSRAAKCRLRHLCMVRPERLMTRCCWFMQKQGSCVRIMVGS
jgi:hypothetical protein